MDIDASVLVVLSALIVTGCIFYCAGKIVGRVSREDVSSNKAEEHESIEFDKKHNHRDVPTDGSTRTWDFLKGLWFSRRSQNKDRGGKHE